MMSDTGKIKKRSEIIEIIGICIIITALISAYGIYYISNEYAKVTETQMNIGAYVPYGDDSVSVTYLDNHSIVNVNIAVSNIESRLDVDIYLIEYSIYISDEPIVRPDYNDYIGMITSSASGNDILEAGTGQMYNIPITFDSDNEYYSKLTDVTEDGSGYVLIQGRAHYKIMGSSGLQDSIMFYYGDKVSVNAG